MSTTITIDDAAEKVAKLYAQRHDLSLSKAISEIVMRHASEPDTIPNRSGPVEAAPEIDPSHSWIKYVDGIPVFNVPRGRTIRNEEIRALMDEDF